MGVYIKGMEMPKSCCACPLFKSNMSKQLFCKAFGAFDKSDYDKLPIERMKNCPLVPVPPHYDLIDHNALKKAVMDCDAETRLDFLKHAMDCINKAPVVIPSDMPTYEAEEGE